MENTLLVFTSQTIERMTRQGGSTAWVVDAKRVRACQYIVCSWNAVGDGADTSEGHQHREAFLIAPITSVEPSSKYAGRSDIRFTEFKRISIPEAWPKTRNPVTYTSLADLGIDPDALTFEPVNESNAPELLDSSSAPTHADGGPLAISAAKPRLAAYYDVPIDAIEIVIRG